MAHGLPSPSHSEPDHRGKTPVARGAGRLTETASVAAAPTVPASPAQLQNVVSLYSEQADFDDDPDAPAPDWSSAFQLIRDVGAQIRVERDRAQATVQQSQSLIRGVIAQAEEAEVRAEAAEVAAYDATGRADRADAQVRLAEERAQQAEDRALAAQAGEKEARLLLRRLHAALKGEYDGLMTAPK